jgi:acyl carrier protein phosphodiesterase
VLGDLVRGRDLSAYPAPLQAAIRQHRRVDALTDAHPVVAEVRARFAPGARRYAGIVLDVAWDHALARRWAEFSTESLAAFAQRAGEAIESGGEWFVRAGGEAPDAARFAELLRSYESEAGIDRALGRIARRLREPQRLLDAAAPWREHFAALQPGLAPLLSDLRAATG